MKCVHPTASGGVSHKPRNFYGDTLNIVAQYEAHDIPHSFHPLISYSENRVHKSPMILNNR
jgi:hypothetical protein